jgi:hypothetical protein
MYRSEFYFSYPPFYHENGSRKTAPKALSICLLYRARSAHEREQRRTRERTRERERKAKTSARKFKGARGVGQCDSYIVIAGSVYLCFRMAIRIYVR